MYWTLQKHSGARESGGKATGYLQGAYDTECAVIARALETAARRRHALGRVTIFRMTSYEPEGTGSRLAGEEEKRRG